MKREGRQHGLVATACLPPCNSLDQQHQDAGSHRHRHHHGQQRPTAGIFIKVSQKPTNHSKYTSRCPRPRCTCCHTFPAGKAKDKTKGSHKVRSSDVVTNYRLLTWRVAEDVDDARPGLKLSGFSASGIMDHLDYCDDDDDDEYDGSTTDDDDDQLQEGDGIEMMINPIPNIEEIENSGRVGGDDDDGLSYCNVGIVWEQVNGDDEEEVEGWCLVQEF